MYPILAAASTTGPGRGVGDGFGEDDYDVAEGGRNGTPYTLEVRRGSNGPVDVLWNYRLVLHDGATDGGGSGDVGVWDRIPVRKMCWVLRSSLRGMSVLGPVQSSVDCKLVVSLHAVSHLL